MWFIHPIFNGELAVKDLNGKVAFITGGASGIGLGMAKEFLNRGMKVAIADIQKSRLVKAESTLNSPGNVLTIELDVSDLAAVESAADLVEAEFGKVHVVCNNAGVGSLSPLGYEMSEANWKRIFEINVNGVFNGIHTFVPRILKHGEGGHIVNTASTAGLQPNKGQLSYCATKYAVVGMSEVLRKDLADESVSVSVLCPWVVDTPIFHKHIDDDDTEAIQELRKSKPWLDELAVSPDLVGEQVANAIVEDDMFVFCDGTGTKDMVGARTKDLLDNLDRQFPKQG
jgi:NAD(P)-dependent dehydrogenase (short-subunit alcohol dehydrogenase family)